MSKRSRISKVGTLFSQFLNVVLFGGSPDESISGRSYRQGILEGHQGWSKASSWIDWAIFWQPQHTYHSHQEDISFAQVILIRDPKDNV